MWITTFLFHLKAKGNGHTAPVKHYILLCHAPAFSLWHGASFPQKSHASRQISLNSLTARATATLGIRWRNSFKLLTEKGILSSNWV